MTTKEFIIVPCNLKINNTAIADILHKAFEEGGSLHWTHGLKIITIDGKLILECMDGSTHQLTLGKLTMGIQQALPYLGKVINGLNLDVGSLGPEDADFILQLALFDEILYD